VARPSSDPALFDPKPSHFGPAILWLKEHGVADRCLANLFDISSENIRVLCHRVRRQSLRYSPSLQSVMREPLNPSDSSTSALRASTGVRGDADLTLPSKRATVKLEALAERIDSVVAEFQRDYRFVDGVAALKSLLPQIGYPSDVRRIRLLSRLRQHRTWFLVHSGLSVSSLHEARQVMALSTVAFRESGDPSDLVSVANAGLVASNACLLRNDPKTAERYLRIFKEAVDAAGARPGSEYHRQLGTIYFLDRNRSHDDLASNTFVKAAEMMLELGEAKNPAQVLMVGTRTQMLLDRDWDRGQELVAETSTTFPPGSLESSMNIHWAVACGLSTDSRYIEQQALELLEKNRSTARQFGHQATISKLLKITPDQGHSPGTRAARVRRALYENAFRNQ
jgi:hypothetical protein